MRKVPILFMALALGLTAGTAWAAGGYSEAQKSDLLYRLMNFAVFFGVLFWLLRKPVGKFFRDRREGIARNLDYLETQARNLEEQNAILNKEIANITAERDSILAQYEKMGRKEADRVIAEAKTAAENIVRKTQAAMDLEMKAARQALMVEIVRISTRAADEMLRNNINDDDQKRLNHEFMEQVRNLKSLN